MNAQSLLDQLGAQLGTQLPLSANGTCRVLFDEDAVDFEQAETGLYIMADLADASQRADAYERLLTANYLGSESGGACISLDANRHVFMLHMRLVGDVAYPDFEKELCGFIRALRYWKEWLALPRVKISLGDNADISFNSTMLRI